MTDRRYTEDEVREIFGLAADRQARLPTAPAGDSGGDGLTLSELQAIGREVGLEPERVAEAASLVERRGGALRRPTYLGLPISVGRTVDLPRALTDTEWEVLVGELRSTFGARGRVASQGGLREWVNGNLHVFQETTTDGYRLRMRTTKGTAIRATWIGAAFLVMAVLLVLMQLEDPSIDFAASIFLGGTGLAALGSNAVILPRWARERERQMEYVADRALELTASSEEEPS